MGVSFVVGITLAVVAAASEALAKEAAENTTTERGGGFSLLGIFRILSEENTCKEN